MRDRHAIDVVFDLGGVLIDWDPRYLYRGHLGAERAEVEAFLRDVCTPAWHARIDGGLRLEQAAAELAARHPEHAGWISLYGREWARMFAGPHRAAVECLRELRAAGHRVHALSNYPSEKIAFLYRTFPFMAEFHSVVLSGIVGRTKPDRAVFEYLAALLGRGPCIFVDDRPENVAAARRCGLEAIAFTPEKGVTALLEKVAELAGRGAA